MKREIKCDRKSNACFLSPRIVQIGKGGLVPLGTTYLIPLNELYKSRPKTSSQAGRGAKNYKAKQKPEAKSVPKKPSKEEHHP